MARVEITFCQAGGLSRESQSMPVARLDNAVTEVVTSSASSAKTTTTSTASSNTGFVLIYASADIWAVAGPTTGLTAVAPIAGETKPGIRVPQFVVTSLSVANGDVVAVINAPAMS